VAPITTLLRQLTPLFDNKQRGIKVEKKGTVEEPCLLAEVLA